MSWNRKELLVAYIITITVVAIMSSQVPLSAKSHLVSSSSLKYARAITTSAASILLSNIGSSSTASAALTPMPDSAYTTLGDMKMCRILNGMWQVSGSHGYEANREDSVNAMTKCAFEGFTSFDLADHYGPAEDFVGAFSSGPLSSTINKECQFFTKWVPRPEEMNQKIVDAAIDRSLRRMRKDQLDLLQFHWWDYNNKYYYDAMAGLMHLQDSATPKIRNIGLTNFDTEHLLDLIDQDAPIVSNQVSFSIIDSRPLKAMVPACVDKNVKLLCYGTLLGGFLTDYWISKPEPSMASLSTVSLRKYLPWILYWGSWELFQNMLAVLRRIADKHGSSVANVSTRWVLEQPGVGGAIVGARLGLREHLEDNRRVFGFALDANDLEDIAAVSRRGRDLRAVLGDCGGEYRRRG